MALLEMHLSDAFDLGSSAIFKFLLNSLRENLGLCSSLRRRLFVLLAKAGIEMVIKKMNPRRRKASNLAPWSSVGSVRTAFPKIQETKPLGALVS